MGLIGVLGMVVICFGIVYYTNNIEPHKKTEMTELANDRFGRVGCICFVMLILVLIGYIIG